VAIVDKFFRVRYKNDDPQALAVKTWSHLLWNCKKIQFVLGIFAIGLTLLALQGPPFYVVVALYVGAVASTCLFGWSLHRYHIAEKELALWQRPGEDFATKRRAALELSLQEMIQKKCHFRYDQPTGTLLGVEILLVFRRDLQQFATPLLARACDTPEQQHQWVLDFFKGNPFGMRFFKDNLPLANEAGWKDIQKFQEQIDQLVTLINTLEKSYVAQCHTNQSAAKEKADAIEQCFSEKGDVFCKKQKFFALKADLFHARVLKILKTECLDPIRALEQKEKEKGDFFGSLVYHQIRALLVEARKGLLEDQPYTLDQTVFTDLEKFVSGNFEQELDAITAPYPQNVIVKAKANAPKEARQEYTDDYLGYIDAAFA
jgi:hypothetical protein